MPRKAIRLYEEALCAFRAGGKQPDAHAGTLCNYAMLIREQGDEERSTEMFHQALAIVVDNDCRALIEQRMSGGESGITIC